MSWIRKNPEELCPSKSDYVDVRDGAKTTLPVLPASEELMMSLDDIVIFNVYNIIEKISSCWEVNLL